MVVLKVARKCREKLKRDSNTNVAENEMKFKRLNFKRERQGKRKLETRKQMFQSGSPGSIDKYNQQRKKAKNVIYMQRGSFWMIK